jgi:hypothetical protein
MATRILTVVAVIGGLVLFATPIQAGGEKKELPAQAQKAKEKLDDYLTTKNAQNRNPQVIWIDSAAIAKSFPDVSFFAVRFRQYPVAILPPAGFKSTNLFAVGKMGDLQYIDDAKALEKFFVKNKATASPSTLKAWLALSPELIQDGFYKFKTSDVFKATKSEGEDKEGTITGSTVVMAGGNGEITATLFSKNDKLTKVEQTIKVRQGIRPKCQATKLLDTDPIVRYMAESELSYMGLAARPYLLEQRAKANPPLRDAIDRLLRKIKAEGW